MYYCKMFFLILPFLAFSWLFCFCQLFPVLFLVFPFCYLVFGSLWPTLILVSLTSINQPTNLISPWSLFVQSQFFQHQLKEETMLSVLPDHTTFFRRTLINVFPFMYHIRGKFGWQYLGKELERHGKTLRSSLNLKLQCISGSSKLNCHFHRPSRRNPGPPRLPVRCHRPPQLSSRCHAPSRLSCALVFHLLFFGHLWPLCH